MSLTVYRQGEYVDSELAKIMDAVASHDELLTLERNEKTRQWCVMRKLKRGLEHAEWPVVGFDEHDPQFTADGVLAWLRSHDRWDGRNADLLDWIDNENESFEAKQAQEAREQYQEAVAERTEFILNRDDQLPYKRVYMSGTRGRS